MSSRFARNVIIRLLAFILTIVSITPLINAAIITGHKSESISQNSASAKYNSLIAMLDQFIQHEVTDKGLPALSIALVEDQQVVWSKGFGMADPDAKKPATAETVYRVGSVSKLFTDIAIMQLVEQGKINLDAPVTTYLPDFKPKNPFNKPITLRQLMSHRSGLVREPPVGNYFDPSEIPLAKTVASLNDTTLVYEPESRTKYSNAAIATVGYALEATQREPFPRYLKRAVLAPLGMRSSSFEPEPEIKKRLAKAYMWTVHDTTFQAPTFELGMAPAGGMYSTVLDLGRFMSVLFAGGRGVLKRETLEQMWTPQFAPAGQKTGFGIGFAVNEIDGHRSIGHGGAIYGFATSLLALPDDKLGVVVVASKDVSNGTTGRIANTALRGMLATREGKSIKQPDTTTQIPLDVAKRIEGKYMKGDRMIEITNQGGVVRMLDLRGGSLLRLRSLSDALVVDDIQGFSEPITAQDNKIISGNETYERVLVSKSASAPEKWKGLIGEYGYDHLPLYIFEKDGRLWTLIELTEFDPLEEVSENVFAFPDRGMYHGERLVFKRDQSGRATQIEAAGIVFKRRQVGPEDGAEQLRIKPVKPVKDLIASALKAKPPKEQGDFLPIDLVELTKLDPTIKLDVRYATTNNFLGEVFYSEPRSFLQRPAAEALVRVHRKLKDLGYGLLVHDGYRPWYVTKVFWDATPEDRKIFVANPANGSRHNRGCAVDLTLYDLSTGKVIEMPGTYDETTDRSYPNYPGGTSLQRWHRELLRDAMEAEGFTVYEAEWWHFDYKDWKRYPIGNVPFDQIGRDKGHPGKQ
jgi:serine beta-lactamase-like protein LACTB